MKKDYCDIFNACFPDFKFEYERFDELFIKEETYCFDYYEDDKCLAFALVEDFAIRLICVLPEHQKKGIGRKIVTEIEKDLQDKGYEKALTGGVSSRFAIGATKESWGFFEKCGYKSVGGCDEMLMELKDFDIEQYDFRGHEVAEYGWYKGDMSKLHEAVAKVDADWVQYFDKPDFVYAAMVDGEVASFCLVNTNCNNYLTGSHGKIGMPGCVGTVPDFRNRGIALEMVARATQYLKDEGMDVSFIFYTGVAKWYEKIGYKTFMSEVFGIKEL